MREKNEYTPPGGWVDVPVELSRDNRLLWFPLGEGMQYRFITKENRGIREESLLQDEEGVSIVQSVEGASTQNSDLQE